MKAKNKVISILLAVFMVFAMMPLLAQEAYANDNLFTTDVIYVGEDTPTVTMGSMINDISFFYDDNGEEQEVKNYFNISGKSFYWHCPDWPEMIGCGGHFEIDCADGKHYSEYLDIKWRITGEDFSEYFSDKTYTGKAINQSNSLDIDLGPTYFTKYDFSSITYSNNKNVGTAKVTLTGKGELYGIAKATFKINPKGATIKTPKRAKTSVTVKWKKQSTKMSKSRITGYQVQCSTTKDFSENVKSKTVKGYKKTSKKITGLQRKTQYYVRVRTYMKVSGKYYYSSWSKVKAVKTK